MWVVACGWSRPGCDVTMASMVLEDILPGLSFCVRIVVGPNRDVDSRNTLVLYNAQKLDIKTS